MTVYPSAQRVMAKLGGVWTDLTSYVIEDITGKWGIQGDGPLDLLADTGALRITLNNMDQRFTPGHASALSGWKKGIPIKLEIDYDGVTYPMLGSIVDINIPLGKNLVDKAYVTMVDWLEYSARDPIVNPGVLTDQRADDVIRTVLGMMPVQPAATDLDTGVSVFPTTFDTVTSRTKAYSEFGKVAFSETGYIYLRKDRIYGETLVFESAHARHGWRELDPLPLAAAGSGFLLKEDGGKLLKEDGGGLLLDQAGTLIIDNDMLDLEADYGAQMINYFTARANPRRIDSSPQILFRLDEPISIAPGQTVTIKGSYADPSGGLPVNAQNMITPAATTDYLVNTAQDGSGTNLTADLVLVSISYGTEGFTHRVRNGSVNHGWITQYNTRGYGIYLYNPIEHVESDQDSIAEFGTQTETLDQKYQVELTLGTLYIANVVEREKQPRTVLHSITFLANQSTALMMAFLNFGPGKLIRIKHTKRGIDSYYYIQGIKDFRLTEGGLIVCSWIVKDALSLLLGLSMLAIELGSSGTTDAVNFGHVPYLNEMPKKTISVWVYRTDDSAENQTILGNVSDSSGWSMLCDDSPNDSDLLFQNKFGNPGPSATGIWRVENVIPLETWIHIVLTYDISSNVYANPLIYIDGAPQTVTVQTTPLGTRISEIGNTFVVGNQKSAAIDYTRGFFGIGKDARVYNRILSQAEITELYNSGTPDASQVTDGLVFQAFAVRTKELSDYVNTALGEADKVLDNIFGVVGTPHGAPVGRAP